jgi:hypothetical protein
LYKEVHCDILIDVYEEKRTGGEGRREEERGKENASQVQK